MLNSALRSFAFVTAAPIFLSAADATTSNRVVTVNFSAVDTRGQNVDDLRSEDLRVSDAGVRRSVLFLRRVGNDPWDPPSLGPNEVSNRGGQTAPFATVVVLDLFNEDFQIQANASQALIHDLQSIPNADSLFLYVLAIDGALLPVHEIPVDLHFHPQKPSGGPPWTAGIKSLLDQTLSKGLGPPRASFSATDRTVLTFQALDTLAVQLSRIPGRKNIVWINNGTPTALRADSSGAGFPFSQHTGESVADYANELKALTVQFNSFGVALYPLSEFLTSNSFLDSYSEAALDALVEQTGGRHNNGKGIGDVIREALRDAQTCYQLGYEEPMAAFDGKVHSIRIATDRKAVRLHTKANYFAAPEPPSADFTRMIDSAAVPAFDAAEIGLHGVIVRDRANNRLAHLHVLVNARDLALLHDNRRFTGILRLAVVGYLKSGRPADAPVSPFELTFHHSDSGHLKLLDAGIQLEQDVTVGPSITKIRLIVLDQMSHAIGTLTLPVEPQDK